jgi:hypothetical protein
MCLPFRSTPMLTPATVGRFQISPHCCRAAIATIDWTLREQARAKIRVMVKRILNKYGYPPDLQDEAVRTELQQAEMLCADWVEN